MRKVRPGVNQFAIVKGARVELDDEEDAIVPAGVHTVSQVHYDGSFRVGGNTAVWPRRVLRIL